MSVFKMQYNVVPRFSVDKFTAILSSGEVSLFISAVQGDY